MPCRTPSASAGPTARCCSGVSPADALPVLSQSIAASPAQLRALAALHPADFPVLLDSAASGPLARHTLLAAYPLGTLTLAATGALQATGACRVRAGERDFLGALQRLWEGAAGPLAQVDAGGDPAPFGGGWFVYLGYELASQIETCLQLPMPMPAPWPNAQQGPAAEPVARAWRIAAALIYDHDSGRCTALAEAGQGELLRRLVVAVQSVGPEQAEAWLSGLGSAALTHQPLLEDAPEQFLAAVAVAREAIARGDIYQANLSRAWRLQLAPGAYRAAALHERLRRANPAPFAALVQQDGQALISSSPERLVRVRDGRVATRPIAGTRPRSGRAGADGYESAELIAHPKERAEHVMLIDLERNDLGRICRAGSVHVDEFMVLERYAHVHHIVSNVSGALRADVTPMQVLRAVFPGGTITGCPKLRSMQIIAALEGQTRGAYTGSLGYVNHDGSMDFNILIRTLSLHGDALSLRAGAGIVADSLPELELAETRAKARGLLLALGLPA
ncbi:MAG: aminodeoxychorismate synthase component I [Steroidobacteraceae bacterium]